MVRRVTFSGEYEKGVAAWEFGYAFDPNTQSNDFMEGYREARAAYHNMLSDLDD